MKNRLIMKAFILIVSFTSVSASTSIYRLEVKPSGLSDLSKSLLEVDYKTKLYVEKIKSYEKILDTDSSSDTTR